MTCFFQRFEEVWYHDAVGFSIVSDTLVLSYLDQLPAAYFVIEAGEIRNFGSCQPTYVSGELVARRWQPATTLDRATTIVPIQVEGGGCVRQGGGTETLTEVTNVMVEEHQALVEIIAWTRDKPFGVGCAGVGVMLDSTVILSAPLGDRQLLDTGSIPATPVP